MTSIKLKFRASTNTDKKGTLYYQIIHERKIRQIKTEYQIYPCEWEPKAETIRNLQTGEARKEQVRLIQDKINWEITQLQAILNMLKTKNEPFDIDYITTLFKRSICQNMTVFEYIRLQVSRLKHLSRWRSSENYQTTLNSFMRFRNDEDLSFEHIDNALIEDYEAYLKSSGIKRNTSSFYMRNLRSIYNQAVEQGLTSQKKPFKRAYTGIDKTMKRAISIGSIKRIKELELSGYASMDFARDMFLLSFYMRGMSFIDMAYLRKKDLRNGFITYSRKKTGQQLTIQWEKPMQEILGKYNTNPTKYLLPIIEIEDGTERQQYLRKMANINRNLKKIGKISHISTPLSMYVSRHSWASIARKENISLSIISEGMGHNSEVTTQIYLASIQTSAIDNANKKILKSL
jgi:site-specific recombinase XerD